MSDKKTKTPALDYAQAGVDIEAGNQLVEAIKPIAKATHRPGVMGGLGGFGAMFEIPVGRYKHPVLVSGTDGVGTKLMLANAMGKHDTIGIDLVAMCVNDIVVQGAEPLYFLDYYATGKLDINTATEVVKGIGKGCELAGAALIGGETAEMPNMYQPGDYDLAGFSVGIGEKDQLLDGSKVSQGDCLIGLPSSGPHSNGYSLIRKIISVNDVDLNQPFEGSTLGQTLLEPTNIYVKSLLALLQQVDVHMFCHITGGGLLENLPRVIPDHLRANINPRSWTAPPIFQWLQEQGNVTQTEMYRTFNCGIGMVVCVAQADRENTMKHLQNSGEKPVLMGQIDGAVSGEPRVTF